MDIQKAATALDGNEYRNEGTPEIFSAMKEHGLVAIFGWSDDLMEFRGAIDDEVGCYDGGSAWVNASGLLENTCESDDCPHYARLLVDAPLILSKWCAEPDISWTYETEIPHAPFLIVEDGDVYCRGIVIDLNNLSP